VAGLAAIASGRIDALLHRGKGHHLEALAIFFSNETAIDLIITFL